jgi:mannosyltransferase
VLIGCAPAYLGQRSPWAKDGGSDWRAVADYVGANAAPDAAVVFDQSTKPSRDPRIALDLYPEAFAGLRDIALETPYGDRPHLWDRTSPNAEVAPRLIGSGDVWAIELTTSTALPADVVLLEDLGYEIETSQLIHRTTVYHLVKE